MAHQGREGIAREDRAVTDQLLRDGAAAARRVAAMHKGGQQQAIHQAVAGLLDEVAGWYNAGAYDPDDPDDDFPAAVDIARAYLGREQP